MAEFLSRKNVKIFQVILKTPIVTAGSSQATGDLKIFCLHVFCFESSTVSLVMGLPLKISQEHEQKKKASNFLWDLEFISFWVTKLPVGKPALHLFLLDT